MHKLLYIGLLLFFVASCSDEKETEIPQELEWDKNKSSQMNKGLAEKEAIDIKLFLEMRPDWKMTETGSGLRIWIYENGDGEIPVPGDDAEIEYDITLLNGDTCYFTEDNEYEIVRVDKSDLETGVQEALKLMHVGDKAKLIVPSHLGHGLLGDMDKIPPLKSLVIDLELTGLRKNR